MSIEFTFESRERVDEFLKAINANGLPQEEIRKMVTLKSEDLKARYPKWRYNPDFCHGFVPLEISLPEFIGIAASKGFKIIPDKDYPLTRPKWLRPYVAPLKNRFRVNIYNWGNVGVWMLIGENPLDDSDKKTYISDRDFNLLRLLTVDQESFIGGGPNP